MELKIIRRLNAIRNGMVCIEGTTERPLRRGMVKILKDMIFDEIVKEEDERSFDVVFSREPVELGFVFIRSSTERELP